MALIDSTYLTGELYIANTASGPVADTLGTFIEKYSRELLNKVLGIEMRQSFLSGLEAASPEQRWLDLRDGLGFATNGGDLEWVGFANSQLKASPIANYVFFKYNIYLIDQSVGAGNLHPTVENGYIASPIKKLTRAWNEMVLMLRSLVYLLEAEKELYPEWYGRCNMDMDIVNTVNYMGL